MPNEEAAEVGESVDGEIGGEGSLLSLFPYDPDPNVGSLSTNE